MNISVGHLALTATKHDLRQLFAPYGVVETSHIMTNRVTGRAQGFGFVEMLAAITGLQGQALAGRALTVAAAKPPELRRELHRSRW